MEKIVYKYMAQQPMGETEGAMPHESETQKPNPEAQTERVSLVRHEPKRSRQRAQPPETSRTGAVGSERAGTNPETEEKVAGEQLRNETKRMLGIDPANPDHAERSQAADKDIDKLLSLKDVKDEAEVDRRLDELGVRDEMKQEIKRRFGTIPARSESHTPSDKKSEEGKPAPLDEEEGTQQALEPTPTVDDIHAELKDILQPVPEGEDPALKQEQAAVLLKKLGKWAGEGAWWTTKKLVIIACYAAMTALVIYLKGLSAYSSGKK